MIQMLIVTRTESKITFTIRRVHTFGFSYKKCSQNTKRKLSSDFLKEQKNHNEPLAIFQDQGRTTHHARRTTCEQRRASHNGPQTHPPTRFGLCLCSCLSLCKPVFYDFCKWDTKFRKEFCGKICVFACSQRLESTECCVTHMEHT